MEKHKVKSLQTRLCRSCSNISFSVSDIQTTHCGFIEIIFHTLLAVSFLHSHFLFFSNLLETPDAFVFRQFGYFTLPSVLPCPRDREQEQAYIIPVCLAHTYTLTLIIRM